MARPELAKAPAADRELADQFVEAGIVDVGADQRPQAGDRALRDVLPVPVPVMHPRVEEGLRLVLKEKQGKPMKLPPLVTVGGRGLTDQFKNAPWEKIRDEIYRGRGA